MDSRNRGSIQSSSGGDEDFHSSRGESISNFLNPSPYPASRSTSLPQFLPHQNPSFFPAQQTHDIQYQDNDDAMWSGGLRSQPAFANFGNLTASSSASSQQAPSPSAPPRRDSERHASRPSFGSDHLTVIKNPKKRTRASRRAPTTVLTTDPINFRQMVQEFTGIPSAPFSGSPYAPRLDLFPAGPVALRFGGHLDTVAPIYPLRPPAHVGLSPFSSPPRPSPLNLAVFDPSVATNTVRTNNTIASNNTSLGASTSNNSSSYPLQSDNLLNPQLQSILHQLGGNASATYGNTSGFPSHETPSASYSTSTG